MRGLGAAGALFLAACLQRAAPELSDDLTGLRLPLASGAALQLVVEASVQGQAAEAELDVTAAKSLVTTGCFDELPDTDGTVEVRRPGGGFDAYPALELRGAHLRGRRLGSRQVGLLEDDAQCLLTLGRDVLGRYALEVDPSRRELAFLPPGSKLDAQGQELQGLDLRVASAHGGPVVSASLGGGERRLPAQLALSTRDAHSSLSEAALRRAGFKGVYELLLGEAPGDAKLPEELVVGFSVDEVVLGGTASVRWAVFRGERGFQGDVLGTAGSDLWGRFHLLLDLPENKLWLARPEVADGRCARPTDEPSAEACFQLHGAHDFDTLVFTLSVWRALPQGARVHLDLLDEHGQVLSGDCRAGVSFAPADRGVSSQHRLPWLGLERSLPGCAATLRQVREVRLALLEEGAPPLCAGTCAFVQHSASGRVVCECQPQLGPRSEAERKFLELYRRLLQLQRVPKDPTLEGPRR